MSWKTHLEDYSFIASAEVYRMNRSELWTSPDSLVCSDNVPDGEHIKKPEEGLDFVPVRRGESITVRSC